MCVFFPFYNIFITKELNIYYMICNNCNKRKEKEQLLQTNIKKNGRYIRICKIDCLKEDGNDK